MSKLSKSERIAVKRFADSVKQNDRNETWVGIRPCSFKNKRKDKKIRRAANKNLCKNTEVFNFTYQVLLLFLL